MAWNIHVLERAPVFVTRDKLQAATDFKAAPRNAAQVAGGSEGEL